MSNNYFFGASLMNEAWVRARGWGDDGKPLYLPGDTRYVTEEHAGFNLYSLCHSSSQKCWFILDYNESHSQWTGYTLRTETSTGSRIARTKKDALVAWQDCLDTHKENAKLTLEIEEENNFSIL